MSMLKYPFTFQIVDGGMMQYAHDFSVSTFAKEHKLCSHQINGSKETIKRGEIQDKDYIGMSKDSSISYDLGIIKPQEKKILEICILIDENRNLSDMEDEIDRVTKIDLDKECLTKTEEKYTKLLKEQIYWLNRNDEKLYGRSKKLYDK